MTTPHQLGRPISHTFAVTYPTATRILECFHDLVGESNPLRSQGALLIGDPDNGKTIILRMLQRDLGVMLPPPDSPNHISSIYIQAPVGASRRDLFQSLAEELGIPLSDRSSADRVRAQCIRGIKERGVKVLLVDELHNLISGPDFRRRIILDDFKTISNAVGIPLICAGTMRAYTVIETDDQYLSRLRALLLPRWDLGREYLGLLKCLEREMGVAAGTFCSHEHSHILWQLSKGLIGRTVRILNGCLKEAIRDGADSIARIHIERSGFSDLPWIEPSGGPIG